MKFKKLARKEWFSEIQSSGYLHDVLTSKTFRKKFSIKKAASKCEGWVLNRERMYDIVERKNKCHLCKLLANQLQKIPD